MFSFNLPMFTLPNVPRVGGRPVGVVIQGLFGPWSWRRRTVIGAMNIRLKLIECL